MRFISILAILATSMAPLAIAQSNPNNGSKSNKPQLMTVVGCLTKTGNTYVITGGSPGAQEFRIISGDTSMLKGKQEDTVKVIGMVGESNPAKDAAPPYNEGSTTGVGYETIAAQKITVLGGLCSNPGQEWKGAHYGHWN
ncbi:MAG TPA: hypothetical protein VMX38_18235 [Verrucomicrobiae bacterium]|jgi:hypothetical protein|nr:hypothetical protein [Verrucomicrobiae bacterium]